MQKENIEEFTNSFAESLTNNQQNKFFAVMYFYRESELGISDSDDWILRSVVRYETMADALYAYANTRCPASQLIEAETLEEFERKINQMRENFKNKEWLEKELYPYL